MDLGVEGGDEGGAFWRELARGVAGRRGFRALRYAGSGVTRALTPADSAFLGLWFTISHARKREAP